MLLFRVLQLWPHDEMWAIEPDGGMPVELSLLRDALADDLGITEQGSDDA